MPAALKVWHPSDVLWEAACDISGRGQRSHLQGGENPLKTIGDLHAGHRQSLARCLLKVCVLCDLLSCTAAANHPNAEVPRPFAHVETMRLS